MHFEHRLHNTLCNYIRSHDAVSTDEKNTCVRVVTKRVERGHVYLFVQYNPSGKAADNEKFRDGVEWRGLVYVRGNSAQETVPLLVTYHCSLTLTSPFAHLCRLH